MILFVNLWPSYRPHHYRFQYAFLMSSNVVLTWNLIFSICIYLFYSNPHMGIQFLRRRKALWRGHGMFVLSFWNYNIFISLHMNSKRENPAFVIKKLLLLSRHFLVSFHILGSTHDNIICIFQKTPLWILGILKT